MVEEPGGIQSKVYDALDLYHRNSTGLLSCYSNVSKTFNADQPIEDLFDQGESSTWVAKGCKVQVFLPWYVMHLLPDRNLIFGPEYLGTFRCSDVQIIRKNIFAHRMLKIPPVMWLKGCTSVVEGEILLRVCLAWSPQQNHQYETLGLINSSIFTFNSA